MKNLLHEFFNSKSDANGEWGLLYATQQEQLEKEFEEWYSNRQVSFEESVEPLMKWLSENKHPMCRVIVDCSNAELLEGLQTHVNHEFIKD